MARPALAGSPSHGAVGAQRPSRRQQAERLHFRAWAGLRGAISKRQLNEICVDTFMLVIFLADDPDPESG
jgi:hypothetical protein